MNYFVKVITYNGKSETSCMFPCVDRDDCDRVAHALGHSGSALGDLRRRCVPVVCIPTQAGRITIPVADLESVKDSIDSAVDDVFQTKA